MSNNFNDEGNPRHYGYRNIDTGPKFTGKYVPHPYGLVASDDSVLVPIDKIIRLDGSVTVVWGLPPKKRSVTSFNLLEWKYEG